MAVMLEKHNGYQFQSPTKNSIFNFRKPLAHCQQRQLQRFKQQQLHYFHSILMKKGTPKQ